MGGQAGRVLPQLQMDAVPMSGGLWPVRCDNNSVHCRAWADRGECRANPEYMNIYCSKACRSGSCSKQNRDCKDKNKDCGTWGKKGFCRSGQYVNYMKQNCKKTCKL